MKKQVFVLFMFAAVVTSSCGGSDSPFEGGPVGMDPDCEDPAKWRDVLQVDAQYEDSGEISLSLDVGDGLVELSGELDIDGAAVGFIFYDVASIWCTLLPDDGVTEIVVSGSLVCTAAEEPFVVTLMLNPDDREITHTIEFGEVSDGGVAADAGV